MPETFIPRPSPLPPCPICAAAVYSVSQDTVTALRRPAHPKLAPAHTPVGFTVTLSPCGDTLEYLQAEEYVADYERAKS